jgi:molybdenum cofactor cytidylyltransferase
MENRVGSFPLILLCGGKSSRMGMAKGLIEVEGRPWLMRQLESFRSVGGETAVVVFGYGKEEYRTAIPELFASSGPWSVVINEAPEYGPFSSIACAAKIVVGGKRDGAFVLPVDVPVAGREVWEGLVRAFRPPVRVCAPALEGKKGHPVLLSSSFLRELTELPFDSPESRLDTQIRKLPAVQRATVSVKDGKILENMNTPSDLGAIG